MTLISMRDSGMMKPGVSVAMMVVAGSTGKCFAQTSRKFGIVLLVAQVDLRLHDGVEVRADGLQRRLHLAADDEVGLELDRDALPQAAAALRLGIEARLVLVARFGGLPGTKRKSPAVSAGL